MFSQVYLNRWKERLAAEAGVVPANIFVQECTWLSRRNLENKNKKNDENQSKSIEKRHHKLKFHQNSHQICHRLDLVLGKFITDCEKINPSDEELADKMCIGRHLACVLEECVWFESESLNRLLERQFLDSYAEFLIALPVPIPAYRLQPILAALSSR